MTDLITRRSALALTGAAALAACGGNKGVSAQTELTEAATSGGTWSSGVPLPFPVQEIYPCDHDGALHLAGGFIAENGRITGPTAAHHCLLQGMPKWKQLSDLPVARHHPHLISFDGQLLAFAGFESPAADKAWNMQATGWSMLCINYPQNSEDNTNDFSHGCSIPGYNGFNLSELPAPCAEAVTGVLGDDTLHLAGGRTPKGEANANWSDHIDADHHFVLTDLNSAWETAAPCLSKRNSAAGDVVDGNLHVVGGRTVGGGNVATHEVYDYREDRWRSAAPMPQAQGGLAAAAVGGKLYAFGGEYFDNGGGVYPESWVYDPATDTWSALPDMPNPRHGLGAVALDGKVYVIGGALQASGVDTSAIVDVFTP